MAIVRIKPIVMGAKSHEGIDQVARVRGFAIMRAIEVIQEIREVTRLRCHIDFSLK
jgi:hypothetical protein